MHSAFCTVHNVQYVSRVSKRTVEAIKEKGVSCCEADNTAGCS
jgi:hypothetical protein